MRSKEAIPEEDVEEMISGEKLLSREGRREGRKEGRKEGRREGRKEG